MAERKGDSNYTDGDSGGAYGDYHERIHGFGGMGGGGMPQRKPGLIRGAVGALSGETKRLGGSLYRNITGSYTRRLGSNLGKSFAQKHTPGFQKAISGAVAKVKGAISGAFQKPQTGAAMAPKATAPTPAMKPKYKGIVANKQTPAHTVKVSGPLPAGMQKKMTASRPAAAPAAPKVPAAPKPKVARVPRVRGVPAFKGMKPANS